jgi:hypothetical protein
MMEAPGKKDKNNELIISWSKWLITINLFATTGCIVGLKTAGEATEKVGMYFFAAILSFCLSVTASTLFVFLLAKQNINGTEKDVTAFVWLAKLQWILFTIGLAFVLIWIGFLSKVF